MKPNVERELLITAEYLRSIMDYDPGTGMFICRQSRGGVKAGTVLGFRRGDGYIQIKVDGRACLAHRLAWLWMHGEWPPEDMDLDHINRIKHDNRIDNIRLGTRTQNSANAKRSKNNTSGHSGVFYLTRKDGRSPRWIAYLTVNRKTRRIGAFKTKEEAILARRRVALFTHGQWVGE